MPNLCSSCAFIIYPTSTGTFSNQLPSTASSEPIKQRCSVGVTFLAFFGDFDKKLHPALSISHLLLRMRYSVMYLKGPEGFLACLAKILKIELLLHELCIDKQWAEIYP
jgi:hypothetical protein